MLHKQTWPHLLDNEENELQIVPQSLKSMERHAWCPTYFQKQIQPPSSKLLQKVAICAGKDRAHWRDKDRKALLLDGNSFDKSGHPLVQRKDGCIMGILYLCPLMEINRHSWPERCLLEVNTLNILMIYSFLIFWWLNPGLPCLHMPQSPADGMHVHYPLCILGRARCSSVPRSSSGCNIQLQPVRSKLSCCADRSGDLLSSQSLTKALQALQCFYLAIKMPLQLTCPTHRHFGQSSVNAEVLQPSRYHRRWGR